MQFRKFDYEMLSIAVYRLLYLAIVYIRFEVCTRNDIVHP